MSEQVPWKIKIEHAPIGGLHLRAIGKHRHDTMQTAEKEKEE